MRIIYAGAYQAAKQVHFPPHKHGHWELVYYRSGAIECVMGDQCVPGFAGLAWLTPPGVTHAERALTAYSNYHIGLEMKDEGRWPAFLNDDVNRSIGQLCEQIVREFSRQFPERIRILRLLTEHLDCLLDRAAREQVLSRPAQIVAQAERLMEERCGGPLTIAEVARAANVSESALRGYFRSVRGCAPRAHLQQVRLEKACGSCARRPLSWKRWPKCAATIRPAI